MPLRPRHRPGSAAARPVRGPPALCSHRCGRRRPADRRARSSDARTAPRRRPRGRAGASPSSAASSWGAKSATRCASTSRSAATRGLRIVTDGMLLRLLQDDPFLEQRVGRRVRRVPRTGPQRRSGAGDGPPHSADGAARSQDRRHVGDAGRRADRRVSRGIAPSSRPRENCFRSRWSISRSGSLVLAVATPAEPSLPKGGALHSPP